MDLQRVRTAVRDPEERRRAARVIRQLRARLDVGIPKHRAAEALGISPQALERWVRAGALATVTRPGSSRELIERDALLRLAAEVRRHEGEARPVAAAITALGKRLAPKPRPNSPARELRYEYLHTSPADRLRTTVTLSETLHAMAARARERQAAAGR